MTELGGIARHYLNHGHEALFASDSVGLPVFVHEAERAAVAGHYRIRGTFSRRHVLDEDFEVIPTPGHTPGATAYLWDSGDHRVLFTGDTIYLRDGEWVAAVLSSSDRAAYIDSLELMRDLDFDVLAPVGRHTRAVAARDDRAEPTHGAASAPSSIACATARITERQKSLVCTSPTRRLGVPSASRPAAPSMSPRSRNRLGHECSSRRTSAARRVRSGSGA